MNGEVPSVPITTLAGIASLTDLLPELPVAGPSPSGPPCSSTNFLYHDQILASEATAFLSRPNELLASQITHALSTTPVDHVQLNTKNVAAFSQNSNVNNAAAASTALGSALFHRDQNLFQPLNLQQRQLVLQQQQWNQQQQQQQQQSQNANATNTNNYSPGYGQHQSPAGSIPSGFTPQGSPAATAAGQNNQNYKQQASNNGYASSSSNNQAAAAVNQYGDYNNDSSAQLSQQQHGVQQPQQQQVNGEVPVQKQNNHVQPQNNSSDNSRAKAKPVLMLNKLSKEDEELMQKSLKAFAAQNPEKAQKMGMNSRSNNRQNSDGNASSDSESDDGDGSPKKLKSKFFRATEKERVEEKSRLKEERRKRRLEMADDLGAESFGKRRRTEIKKAEHDEEEEPPKPFVPKKVTRKVERKLIPMLMKIDADELMDSGMFTRFNRTVEVIFDNMEDINLKELEAQTAENEDFDLPPEVLIGKFQLQDLAYETAKLKSMGAMESVPVDKLVKLLTILELNIRDGAKVVPLADEDDEDEEKDKLWLDMAIERVTKSADAVLTVLNIMTAKKMDKRVYIDDVIDRVALFLRFHLANTIYPSYDPVYKEITKSKTGYVGSMKKKRSYAHSVRDKNILALYNKVTEMTAMLADLIKIQVLTDTTVLHISTLGVTPFFVEAVPELQLSALKLVTNLFSKYEKHRKLLLDDILASIARLPSSKRSLRTYRLNSDTYIQMLTALVLQLIQCVVVLPKKLALKDENMPVAEKNDEPEVVDLESNDIDRDVLINDKYEMAMATAHQFITVFLKKCGSKNEDIDYRPLFENFVQDLLTTVNTPEWPAAELLLSLLGRVLIEKFRNRSTEMALRISSLEYLGVVAARLRKDAVQSKLKIDYIDSIVKAIKEEEERENGTAASSEDEDDPAAVNNKQKNKKTPKKAKPKPKVAVTEEEKEQERTQFLQRVLLDYLAVNGGETDQATMNARHFYIGQWYRDVNAMGRNKSTKTPKKRKRRRASEDSSEEESEDDDEEDIEENMTDAEKMEYHREREIMKDFLVKKILPFGVSRGKKAQVLSTHIDQDSALLIVRYLSSKRPFFNSFDSYLTDIVRVLSEQSTQVRTKALKCVTMIVNEDPDVLLRGTMQTALKFSLCDTSTNVREAAVDLVGKFILHKQDLITQYYGVITERILDTGVSVRKRVIRILREICLEFPGYSKIPEICVKMIRRVNDEEGIRKLVMDVFQNMWFIPVRERHRTPDDEEQLLIKARNITEVVVKSYDSGLGWFEQLLETMFRPKEDKEDSTRQMTEPPPQVVLASQQIVDCLVESVLRMEENDDQQSSKGSSNRLVACLTTLYSFAKIRPQLLVGHVQTLQPYLSITCRSRGDYEIIANVARTMELTVPLIKHPSEIFLSQLEESSVKLILQHDKKVIAACLSCLGSVVNEVTKNFALIRDCYNQYYGKMKVYRKVHQENSNDPRLSTGTTLGTFRRAMYTVGLLLRHFDFGTKELYQDLPSGEDTVDQVFSMMFYFMRDKRRVIQIEALNAIGSVCVRHHQFMMGNLLKNLYIDILSNKYYPVEHKIQVLSNIESFLIEEEARMIKQDHHWKEYAQKENLKEMNDVSSGMASAIIQVYLKATLDSFLHKEVNCRLASLKVISIILSQGLVHPAQIVPYLICMATDCDTRVSHAADRDLQDIEKKYPGFIHMKLLQGIKLSFQLQQIIQDDPVVVRGMRINKQGDLPTALNGYLYSIMKNTKAQRRGILMSLLKQFDDTYKSSLSMMLYLADNLAYIPYTVLDEPLFVIHHIDIQISVSGSNLLQSFKEGLKPPPSCEQRFNLETGKTEYIYDEDLDDDEESVFERLPDDPRPLQDAITAAQGCNLLLVLKEHLKELYGLTAAKLSQYSPTDTSKAFDRQVNRRNNVIFKPKATIEILRQGDPPEVLDEQQKLDLVQKYMEFKELMNKIDPEDEEDEDGNPIVKDPDSAPAAPRTSYRSRGQALAQEMRKQQQENTNFNKDEYNF